MTDRERIYEGLNEARFYLMRRECTPRVMSESGVDALLDELILIQEQERGEFEEIIDGTL